MEAGALVGMLSASSDTQPPLFVDAGAVLLSAELVHVLICTHDAAEESARQGSPQESMAFRGDHAEALAEVRAASEVAGEQRIPMAVDTRRGCPCGQVAAR